MWAKCAYKLERRTFDIKITKWFLRLSKFYQFLLTLLSWLVTIAGFVSCMVLQQITKDETDNIT